MRWLRATMWRGVPGARGRELRMAVIQPPGVVVHLMGQVARDAEERIAPAHPTRLFTVVPNQTPAAFYTPETCDF